MKRSPMPARRTRLQSKVGLRTGGQLRRSPLAAVSQKRQAEQTLRDEVWAAVLLRDQHCLLAGRVADAGRCRGRLTPHHLRKAGQGGRWVPNNIVVLCAGHNGWVEDYPRTAWALGLVIRAGETAQQAWARMRARGLTKVVP